MPDLAATAHRLYRRLLGRAAADGPRTGEEDVRTEADGTSAVAALEASIGAADGRAGRAGFATALGLAATGERAAAFVSGPELAASVDLLAQAARRRLPLVVHVAAGGGHEACHAAAATGAAVLFAADVQDAVDLTLLARRLAEDALMPVAVAMDEAETALSVQDVRLPPLTAVRRLLGRPGDVIHPPTPGQRTVFGTHRRRLPRWHDPERPLLHGPALGGEAAALAGAARRAFFDVDLPALLARAFEAFTQEIGRRPEGLRHHHAEGARYLLVTQGAAVETAEAVTVPLRAAGVAVGTVGLRVLRPFPEAGWIELLRGRRGVIVLERVDAPLAGEGPLARELRALLERVRGARPDDALPALSDREVPRLLPAFYGSGGFPLRARDLFALVRRCAEGDGDGSSPVYLGFDPAAAAARYPKLEALHDALRRDYPDSERLGLSGDGEAVPELLPGEALAVSVHHVGPARAFTRELAVLLSLLRGGQLRTRPDVGGGGWGAERADLVLQSTAPFRHPGDGIRSRVAVRLPGCGTSARALELLADGGVLLLGGGPRPAGLRREAEQRRLRVYAAGGDGEDRLLGALAGVLGMEGAAEVSLRKLLKARRDMLAGEDGVEARLDELQAGFERVARLDVTSLDDDAPAAVDAGPPTAARRLGKSASPAADLPGFWDRAGVLYRDGRATELVPDPFFATGAVPPLTSTLRDLSPVRTLLPAFDPALCTGCGACWTACPDGAVAPAVVAPAALLDLGMSRAKAAGGSVDKLRMVTSKLASQVQKDIGDGGAAGPLFDAACDAVLGKMKLADDRKAEIREAWQAVSGQIADLPLARTAPFFDQGGGELVVLAIDPDACKGCGLCVAACEPQALTAAADDAGRLAAARALWSFCDELPDAAAATIEHAREHPDVGPLAGALLARAARGVMAGGHGAEPGSGGALALRQTLGAAVHHLRPAAVALLAGVRELREKLAEAIHGGLSHALPDRDLDALARGLDALGQPDAELAELTARVETAFENERVDVTRTRRLVDAARALADLEWRLETGEGGLGRAPLSVVLAAPGTAWAAAFPYNPFRVPVAVDETGDAADLARGLAEGLLAETVETARVLRRARLELDRPQQAARAAEELERLAWRDLTDDERRSCPPVFLVTTEEAFGGLRLGSILELLAGEAPLPVKLLVLTDSATEDAPSSALCHMSTTSATKTFFVQSSVAHPSHLENALARALEHDGPAVLRVLSPGPERGGFPSDATLERAREVVESGAFPLSGASVGQAAPAEVAVSSGAEADPARPAEVAALEQRHAAQIAALGRDYEARLAAERARFQVETAQRVRARLMRLALSSPSAGSGGAPEAPS